MLVVVYTDDGFVLLLRRARPFAFWQSVTGSLRANEAHAAAAARELLEETGLTNEGVLSYSGVSRQFAIDSRWRDRFGPGVIENVEFEWHYRLPCRVDIRHEEDEHSEYGWFSFDDALERIWSWTNRDAVLGLACRS